MPTVIDALVMTLGLDTKDYKKNQKETSQDLDKFKKQSDAVAKGVAEGGKKMAEGFIAIRNQVIGLLAVVTAGRGLKNFLSDGVTGMADLGRLSKNLSMSARDLDSWGAAAESVGGTAAGMQQSLQALAGGIEEFKLTGQSPMMSVLRSLGVNATDQGKVRAYGDILLDLADRFKGMSAQDSLAFGKRLGFDDSTIYLLRQGRDAVAQLRTEMEKNSGVNEKTVEDAQRIQAMWAKVERQAKGLGDSIFSALEPAITLLVGKLSAWIDKNRDLIRTKALEWVEKFVNWLPKFIDQLGKLIDRVDGIVEAFGGWKTVGIALGAILTLNILKPVLSIVGGLARMIPMLSSAAAGMGLLAAAAAGAAGYAVGTVINDKVVSGTRAGDWVGRQVATALSLLGDEEATQSVIQENWASLTTEQRQARRAVPLASGSGLPRGARNRNPGNLNYAGQAGATKESGPGGRFAVFSTMQEGVAAMVRQLNLYSKRGIDTISEIVNTYAPKGDHNNVEAYIRALVQDTGKGENEKLDLGDMKTLIPLVKAIIDHEGNGKFVTSQDIAQGILIGAGQKVTENTAQRGNSSTSETNIKEINIHTPATDARGIAATIRPAIARTGLVSQANTGMG